MALSYLNRQTASWKLSHGWIVKVAIDLATFYGMRSSKQPQLAAFHCFRLNLPLCDYLSPFHHYIEALVVLIKM